MVKQETGYHTIIEKQNVIFLSIVVLLMLLGNIVIVFSIDTNTNYITFKLKIVYPDGEPASNVTVLISRTRFSATNKAFIVGEGVTDTNGSVTIKVSRDELIGQNRVYVYVILYPYNVLLLRNPEEIVLQQSINNTINASIKLSTKPKTSHIAIRIIDEYGEDLSCHVKLWYGNTLIFEAEAKGYVYINSTTQGYPILDSKWLKENGGNPEYNAVIYYNNSVHRELKVEAPYNNTVIIDLHDPIIVNASANITYSKDIGYVEVNAEISVADGLNTNETTAVAQLVYCSKNISLYGKQPKLYDGTKVFVFSYSSIDKRIVQCRDVYVRFIVTDQGGHQVEAVVVPVKEVKSDIYSNTTSSTSITTNGTATFTGAGNTIAPPTSSGKTLGTATFTPPSTGLSTGYKSSPSLLEKIVFIVVGVAVIILEYYRRRIQGTFHQ